MRTASRLALLALLLAACGADPEPEAPAEAEAAPEDEGPPPNPCRSAAGIREALDLGAVRLQHAEEELTGAPPAEVVAWYAEPDPDVAADPFPRAKRGRLFVLDCSGDAPRSLGERSFRYADDPSSELMTASPAGLRTRPVRVGGRTFLRVDMTSRGARASGDRVAFVEVHEGALREVFACETSRYVIGDDGAEETAREVRLVEHEGAPRVEVRAQQAGAPVQEATYAWRDGAFVTEGEDLCAVAEDRARAEDQPAEDGPDGAEATAEE